MTTGRINQVAAFCLTQSTPTESVDKGQASPRRRPPGTLKGVNRVQLSEPTSGEPNATFPRFSTGTFPCHNQRIGADLGSSKLAMSSSRRPDNSAGQLQSPQTQRAGKSKLAQQLFISTHSHRELIQVPHLRQLMGMGAFSRQ